MLGKEDLKQKSARRDKKGHNVLTKATTKQEKGTVLNIHPPNVSASKCIKKHIEHKGTDRSIYNNG
jgi:hypothetical protein